MPIYDTTWDILEVCQPGFTFYTVLCNENAQPVPGITKGAVQCQHLHGFEYTSLDVAHPERCTWTIILQSILTVPECLWYNCSMIRPFTVAGNDYVDVQDLFRMSQQSAQQSNQQCRERYLSSQNSFVDVPLQCTCCSVYREICIHLLGRHWSRDSLQPVPWPESRLSGNFPQFVASFTPSMNGWFLTKNNSSNQN